MAQSVFYDPRQARWRRIRPVFDALGIALMLLILFFAYSALRGQQLPELLLPLEKKPYHALKETERQKAKERRRLAVRRSHFRSGTTSSQFELDADQGVRAAFYVPWDAASFSSLREYARQIDLLYPEWLHTLTPDGHLQGVDPQTNKYFDVIQGTTVHPVDDKVMPFLKSEDTGTEVFPLVNNFDGTDWVDITSFLNSPDARARFRQEVGIFLAGNKYRGLMVDFETFPKKGQHGFLALLHELSNDLHQKGMKLYVSVPSRNDEWNYAAVAAASDGVVLMNYDEHYPSPGTAGPVASQDWFTANLESAAKVIPRNKLICAIANYGYDWVRKPKKRKLPPGVRDFNVSVQNAWLTARDSEADIDFDGDSLNPHIKYLDEHNLQHDVWFLDAVTAFNQMRAAQGIGIEAYALWRLGSEDRSLWAIWDAPGEAGASDRLKEVPPGQDVDMEGTGEILKIEAVKADGKRSMTLDSSGQITDENLDPLPEPYRVARYGSSSSAVALTFDDGPDPQWTPRILDVLKRKNATATFFLIGIEAENNSALAARIYREGNSIGNHTFTHPDISNLSGRYMKLEVNLTEELFASRLGIKSILFRPPYSIDAEPDTEDQVRPLEFTQNMGYITVGDKIDTNDWQGPSAAQIEETVLDHLPPCAPADLKCGNIILMHDGGGNRLQTLLALPAIIDGIRAKGLQIVPLYQLIGKTRADVMPMVPPNDRWSANLIRVAFWLYGLVNAGITWVFILGDILMTARMLFIGACAIFDRFHTRQYGSPSEVASYKPSVAVLIPAYNEAKVIERTVRAVLASNYPKFRIIVIDDGSADDTFEVARRAFAEEELSGRVLVLSKPNSGKAEALNFGLMHVHEEIFLGIDADTIIAPNAMSRLIPHFLNPTVGAVAGNAKVGNRINLWTRWQALEYITSQNFERRALNTLGAVSVVPGAIGAWRMAAVRQAGGFHTDTVAEDADLTMSLLRRGYRVEYEDLALAYTEAPVNSNGLMRQRFRWSFGILQAVWKHREVFARRGILGWVALPNILIFQILLPLVSPFIDIMFLVGTLWYFVQKWFHPESTDPASFLRLVVFFGVFLIIDFVTSAIAFALERSDPESREDTWLLSQVWLQRFAYRQLFSLVLFKTIKRAIQGQRFAWDKLERTAAMTYFPSEKEDSLQFR